MADKKEDYVTMMARLQNEIDKRKGGTAKTGAAPAAPVATPTPTPPPVETTAPVATPVPAAVETTPVETKPTEAEDEEAALERKMKELKAAKAKAKADAEAALAKAKADAEAAKEAEAKALAATTAPAAEAPATTEAPATASKKGRPAKDTAPVRAATAGQSIMMRVGRVYTRSGELVREDGGDMETVATPVFIGPTATVSMDIGRTINLGDYESVKVGVFCSAPCYLEEIGSAMEFVKTQVTNRLMREVEEIRSAKK